MAEKAVKASGTDQPAKRGPGHRAVDARDAIAELTERAQEISLEAGTKVSEAMRDVISAAAGIAGFAVESARDLISYMVRRGQMTPEEGDKLLREAEIAHNKRPKSERKRATASEIQTKTRTIQRAKAAAQREREMRKHIAMVTRAHGKQSKPAKKSTPKAKKKAKKKAKPAGKKKGGKRR
jgi:polyhydroxyalkanoate synthesis regulator phasin